MSSPTILVEPNKEISDSRQQFFNSYLSLLKVYQELVPLESRMPGYDKRLGELKAKPHRTEEDKQEVLIIGRQVNRAYELHDTLSKVSEDIRKQRLKDTTGVELLVLESEIKPLIEAEKFKADFNMDKSQLEIERRVASHAMEAANRTESKINELRAEIGGSSGIDALVRHLH